MKTTMGWTTGHAHPQFHQLTVPSAAASMKANRRYHCFDYRNDDLAVDQRCSCHLLRLSDGRWFTGQGRTQNEAWLAAKELAEANAVMA